LTGGRIRVVHLVLSVDFAGLEMVVFDLARATDLNRFEPHVVCLRNRGGLADRFEAKGIPFHNLDCRTLPKVRTLFKLTRLLRRLRPHVLHTHNPSPHMFGALAAPLAGVPVLVHTKHGRNYPHKPRAVLVNRIATQFTDCIVPVSHAAAEVARRVERVPRRKIHVIRNGIDLAEFPQPDAEAPELGRRAIHVGRLIRLKDQFTLLRATRLVVDRAPDFGLDIIGEGPVREELLALCAELKLQEHVRFLGFRNDVRALLPRAGFFILCSLSEGISISILEAMAAGLPVVATDVGGNREVVGHDQTGLLVPAQAPEALAQAMLAIHLHPERARRMGDAGRLRVKREFDLGAVVARYEALYLALLKPRPGRFDGLGRRPFQLSC
jgi:sugar transferase (PEP-CTERM/EpsH1 system associated)